MAQVLIRPARPADIPDLVRLNDIADAGLPALIAGRDGAGAAEVARRLSAAMARTVASPGPPLVAEDPAGAILGCVQAYTMPRQPDDPPPLPDLVPIRALKSRITGWRYIDYLAVDPAARGQGLGARLLQAAAGRTESEQHPTPGLALIVFEANAPARALYARAGLTEAARDATARPVWAPDQGAAILLTKAWT
ncbi:MAG: GNAT family N-acetyltransferase [Pseudomonadota bacterium]